jgi:hypothetical protein
MTFGELQSTANSLNLGAFFAGAASDSDSSDDEQPLVGTQLSSGVRERQQSDAKLNILSLYDASTTAATLSTGCGTKVLANAASKQVQSNSATGSGNQAIPGDEESSGEDVRSTQNAGCAVDGALSAAEQQAAEALAKERAERQQAQEDAEREAATQAAAQQAAIKAAIEKATETATQDPLVGELEEVLTPTSAQVAEASASTSKESIAPSNFANFQEQELAVYVPSGEVVTVMNVHFDDPEEVYYTVRMEDDREKQTTQTNLRKAEERSKPPATTCAEPQEQHKVVGEESSEAISTSQLGMLSADMDPNTAQRSDELAEELANLKVGGTSMPDVADLDAFDAGDLDDGFLSD